jgi:hypothetical protein
LTPPFLWARVAVMKRGRPKGYSPYIELTYEELGDYVGRKSIVKVSKAWWDSLLEQAIPEKAMSPLKEIEEKIEFNLIDLNE